MPPGASVFKQLLASLGQCSTGFNLYLGNYKFQARIRHQPRCTGQEMQLTDAAKNISIVLVWLTLDFFL